MTAKTATITQEPGYVNTREWPHERFTQTASDGTLIIVSRNGSAGWYVGTYRESVPFGLHHRVVYDAIPNRDRTQALDLGRTIAQAIAENPTYEDRRRGHIR